MQSRLKVLLEIPIELEIYDMMALGYPASEPRPRFVRSKEDLVHQETYDKSRIRKDSDLDQFIQSLRKK
jgi:hypothetical protein